MTIKTGKDLVLRWAETRNFRAGGITEQTQKPLFTVVDEPRHIEVFAIDRGVDKLEVASKKILPTGVMIASEKC